MCARCMHTGIQVDTHVHGHVKARGTHWESPFMAIHLILMTQGLFLSQELVIPASLAGQQAPVLPPSALSIQVLMFA